MTTKGPAASNAKGERAGDVAVKGSSRSAGSGAFLAKTRLKKSGGSLVATMPAAARNLLQLSEGQEMAVTVEGSKVIMEPIPTAGTMRVRRPKYTLDDLLAASDPDAPMTEEEKAWHDAPPVGREVW